MAHWNVRSPRSARRHTHLGAQLLLTQKLPVVVTALRQTLTGLASTVGPRSRLRSPHYDRDEDVAIVDASDIPVRDLVAGVPGAPLAAVMAHMMWSEFYDPLAESIGKYRATPSFISKRVIAEPCGRHLAEPPRFRA